MSYPVLNADMGKDVIRHLRQFANLPDKGLLAGQAVASAVSQLFRDGRAVVYNDLDVFREYDPFEEDKSRKDARELHRVLDTVAFESTEITKEYSQFTLDSFQRYRVIKTSRDGMLNDVACEFMMSSPEPILRTFDMNNVQVGVDLATSKLVWTKHFEEFDRTHQLEIVTMHTPMHSLIRYFKKRQELDGVYGNDERMIEMAAAAYYAEVAEAVQFGGEPEESSHVRWRFGPVYKARLDKVASVIFPLFELSRTQVNDLMTYSLAPKFQVDASFQRRIEGRDDIVHWLPTVSKALREKNRKGISERLQYVIEKRRPTVSTLGWFTHGNTFLKANVTPAEMQAIDSMCEAHHLLPLFLDKTLSEQSRTAKLIRMEVSKRGEWVYGVLENMLPTTDSDIPDWGLTEQGLKELLDREEEQLSKPLAKEHLPVVEFEGYIVRDLVNGLDLQAEGEVMHHCVGGYASSVERGHCRIISFRTAGPVQEWLTMEVNPVCRGSWRMQQLRGLTNRSATSAEMAVATKYIALMCLADFVGERGAIMLWKRFPTSLQLAQRMAKVLESVKEAFRVRFVRRTIPQRVSHWLCQKIAKGQYYLFSPDDHSILYADRHIWRYWKTFMHKKFLEWKHLDVSMFEDEQDIPF